MKIPFLDLSYQTRAVLSAFLERVEQLSLENRFVGGQIVEEFERNFADFCGAPHCVALNSGTDALHLALLASGVEPDAEVITSPFTFIATAEAVTRSARLVFADVDPETFTLDPNSVRENITGRTRALLPVHIFGLPADIPALARLAEQHSLMVIEDACQAHGATLFERRAGSLSEVAAFSFYPTKNLGAFGDAGAVTCRNAALADQIRLLRNHGQSGPYRHEREGYNSRMDAIQATVLQLKLELLSHWNRERQEIARWYRAELQDLSEVRFQKVPEGYGHAYHLVAALVDGREQLQKYLAAREIECRVIYPAPLHLTGAYRHLQYRRGSFPNAELVCDNIICFPAFPGLSEEQVQRVTSAVREFYGAAKTSPRARL